MYNIDMFILCSSNSVIDNLEKCINRIGSEYPVEMYPFYYPFYQNFLKKYKDFCLKHNRETELINESENAVNRFIGLCELFDYKFILPIHAGFNSLEFRISEEFYEWLCKAKNSIGKFQELSMLDTKKINKMLFDVVDPGTEYSRVKESLKIIDVVINGEFICEEEEYFRFYARDRLSSFLGEHFKINELVNEIIKNEKLSPIKRIDDDKYMLNDVFWSGEKPLWIYAEDFDKNIFLLNEYDNSEKFNLKIFFDKNKDVIFNSKSAKVFSFILIDSLFIELIFRAHFSLLGGRYKVFVTETDNSVLIEGSEKYLKNGDEFVKTKDRNDSICIFGDNDWFFLRSFCPNVSIEYLYNLDEVNYNEYAKLKFDNYEESHGSEWTSESSLLIASFFEIQSSFNSSLIENIVKYNSDLYENKIFLNICMCLFIIIR